MATKHINDELWHRIEVLTVRANARQNLIRPVKEADVLHLVLQRGLELLTDDDLLQLGQVPPAHRICAASAGHGDAEAGHTEYG
ncbi:hypothetical protein [Klebsiella pneumoniae]|uniref:hypothetical protein n=1 Tax=Klebsiella pneumoniae TaxID=573 RepID=UPI001D0DB9B6|nr:hypothetical protein [Klebsiella pneumoniae]